MHFYHNFDHGKHNTIWLPIATISFTYPRLWTWPGNNLHHRRRASCVCLSLNICFTFLRKNKTLQTKNTASYSLKKKSTRFILLSPRYLVLSLVWLHSSLGLRFLVLRFASLTASLMSPLPYPQRV